MKKGVGFFREGKPGDKKENRRLAVGKYRLAVGRIKRKKGEGPFWWSLIKGRPASGGVLGGVEKLLK